MDMYSRTGLVIVGLLSLAPTVDAPSERVVPEETSERQPPHRSVIAAVPSGRGAPGEAVAPLSDVGKHAAACPGRLRRGPGVDLAPAREPWRPASWRRPASSRPSPYGGIEQPLRRGN